MTTPIFDFVRQYAEKSPHRFHMPGHKGQSLLGTELQDITEIDGADSLFEANGIIMESETNAGEIFGCNTFYSAEGSSLCIRAMLFLATTYAASLGKKPMIAAYRNIHKSFLYAAAMLDIDPIWLYGSTPDSYLSCIPDLQELDLVLSQNDICALYITAPDYLGNLPDIRAISSICKKHGVLLIVDNAHGAYLKFLKDSKHPIDLGADMCCDSAHKTLCALTGSAYLHISHNAPKELSSRAKDALAIFASTSPSYLILQSLDLINPYLQNKFRKELDNVCQKVANLKTTLAKKGFCVNSDEPLKLTIKPKSYGYSGNELAQILKEQNIYVEFSDSDHTVFMFSPQNSAESVNFLENTLLALSPKPPIPERVPTHPRAKRICGIREAVFGNSEYIDADKSEGRILAFATLSCPPAVPIICCGEQISKDTLSCFEYYGIKRISVLKNK